MFRFLLAQLHLDSLAREDNRRDVRRALAKLPTELMQTYDEAFTRVLSQDGRRSKRARQVLSWIFYASQALTVPELQHALAVEPQDTELDEEALIDEKYLLSSCAGLVVTDTKSGVIRLVHYTTQEYLELVHEKLFPDAQARIAASCLAYLLLDVFSTGSCPTDAQAEARMARYPFLQYAARYWADHAREAPESRPSASALIKRLFEQRSNLESAAQARHMDGCLYRFRGYTQHHVRDITGLQVAASFGLMSTVEILVAAGSDLEARDTAGMSCLHHGAAQGRHETVKMLLDKGADIEGRDGLGMTPLHWAASEGHVTTTRLLIQMGASIEARTNTGETPLYRATCKGHVGVMRSLLETGADVNVREHKFGQTAFSIASWEGSEAVIQLLLEYGAGPTLSETEYGMSPLSRAAEGGRDHTIRLLLAIEGINPNSRDHNGRTALLHAARMGHETAVRLLLGRKDIDPDAADDLGMTPILHAGEKGHDGIFQMLETAISLAPAAEKHPCPLFCAIESGDTGAVGDALGRGADINTMAKHGQTPLILAAKGGLDEIVQLLLSCEGIKLEAKCDFGRTALSWAAGNGQVDAVEQLLAAGADVNTKSKHGRTPLSWATYRGRKAVVAVLVQQADIDPDYSEWQWGESPLLLASEQGHEEIVRLLLERGANPHPRSFQGRTPLYCATYSGHDGIVRLLEAKSAGLF